MVASRWWHYTHGVNFLRIISSGTIVRARALVPKGDGSPNDEGAVAMETELHERLRSAAAKGRA